MQVGLPVVVNIHLIKGRIHQDRLQQGRLHMEHHLQLSHQVQLRRLLHLQLRPSLVDLLTGLPLVPVLLEQEIHEGLLVHQYLRQRQTLPEVNGLIHLHRIMHLLDMALVDLLKHRHSQLHPVVQWRLSNPRGLHQEDVGLK